jgi:hypothetical protein
VPRCSTASYRGGNGGGGRVDHACIRHLSSIAALRRAMTRDAGPLPGRISAFTTGLQSYTETTRLAGGHVITSWRLVKEVTPYFTRSHPLDVIEGIHPVIERSCGGAVSICVT